MPGYYNSYKGSRRRKRNRIRIILLILLLLVLLAAAALFFLQDRAIFTAEGFRFPFSRDPAQEQEQEPNDLSDFHLEIESGDPSAAVPGDHPPTADPVPVEHDPLLSAWQVGGEALLADPDGALSAMQSAGRTQFAVLVKTADHQILVPDAGAPQGGVSPRAADFAAYVGELEQKPAAILPALRDDLRPRSIHRASALKTASGAIWLDRTYTAWYDPTGKDTATDLLARLPSGDPYRFLLPHRRQDRIDQFQSYFFPHRRADGAGETAFRRDGLLSGASAHQRGLPESSGQRRRAGRDGAGAIF